jgi:hypothetical protein
MGEMADFYVQQMQDAYGWSPVGGRRLKPTCQHCGARNLNWQKVKGSRWRLHDGRTVHDCLNKKTTADGFEDQPV